MMAASTLSPLPLVSIGNAWREEPESTAAPMSFYVTLSEPLEDDLLIKWGAWGNEATEGSDFVDTDGGTVTILAGQTMATEPILVDILPDEDDDEGDEDFMVCLDDQGVQGVSFAHRSAYGLIAGTNTDGPSLYVQQANGFEEDGNGSAGFLEFRRAAGPHCDRGRQSLHLDGGRRPMGATAGDDYDDTYEGQENACTIPYWVGVDETFSLQLVKDDIDEEDIEVFTLHASYAGQTAIAFGNIYDSDEGPQTIWVNSVGDDGDDDLYDGIAWTGNWVDGQREVTLRAAIEHNNYTRRLRPRSCSRSPRRKRVAMDIGRS